MCCISGTCPLVQGGRRALPGAGRTDSSPQPGAKGDSSLRARSRGQRLALLRGRRLKPRLALWPKAARGRERARGVRAACRTRCWLHPRGLVFCTAFGSRVSLRQSTSLPLVHTGAGRKITWTRQRRWRPAREVVWCGTALRGAGPGCPRALLPPRPPQAATP